MKRALLVFSLAVCLLVSSQADVFAETVTSKDDPGFYGGTVTVAPGDGWLTNTEFNSGINLAPVPLTSEESAAVAAKEASISALMAADQINNPDLYKLLANSEETSLAGDTLYGMPTGPGPFEYPSASYGFPLPGVFRYFKIPNYNQGKTPYCGPFSALQILRYKKYWEPNLIQNLIREMYIPGQGSNIYLLARSLRKRIKYPYYPLKVTSTADYAYKHIGTVWWDYMPIDNLVRIYGGALGKYRKYHSGHFIDSNGIWFQYLGRRFLYITDTYQEYVNGTASGTLGGQWVSFLQMYRAVRLHPLQMVVW